MNSILRFVFEKLPVLSWFNGKKTEIGRAVTILSGITLLLQREAPGIPYVDVINGWVGLISGLVLKEVGEAHSEAKKKG